MGRARKSAGGEHVDIHIGQTNGNQATKAIVRAGKDATCIAYMSATWTVGKKHHGWTGDWGSICGGLIGFPSGIEVRPRLLLSNRITMTDRMHMTA